MATLTKSGVTVTPLQVLGYASTQQTGNIFHAVIGRTDQDVTFGAAGLRSGTLKYLFSTLPTALACRDMHASVGKIVLAEPALTGVGMTYAPSGTIAVELDDESGYWTVSVDYQEIL